MRRKFYLYLFIFFAFSANSQEIGENNLGAWYMLAGTHRISDKLYVNSAAQLWDYEPTSNFNLFLILTGLRYDVNSKIATTVGYGFASIDGSFESIPNESLIREHRLYEQISLKNNIKKLRVNHRYRLEQRFLNYSDKNNLKHRMRYRLQITIPITNTFFVNVYDEIILNLQDDLFNQNRLYGALGIYITPNSKLQLGYLKHYFSSKAYDRLQVSVAIKTDFRKPKNITTSNYETTSSINKNELLSD